MSSSLVGSNVGPYSILSRVGSGGAGTVYRGIHTQLGRPVALKLLHAAAGTGTQADRLLREAQLQASLRHPGITVLYDFLDVNGQGCIVMEFVEGPTLAEYLANRAPLTPDQALRLLQHVVEAVAYLHAQGIVHRDLKPANIKICTGDSVKLLDFGIAQTVRTNRERTNRVEGTFEYTAPECLLGKPADQRSDIWSVGVLLYEMLTSRLPFAGEAPQQLLRQIDKGSKPARELNRMVSRNLENLIGRCLRKEPAERIATISELLREIEKHRRTHLSFVPTVPRVQWQRGVWIRLSLVAAACVVLAVVWSMISFTRPSGDEANTTAADEKKITVDTVNGAAEVFRNGKDIGRTPVQVQGKTGQHVSLVLKREGFADLPVDFEVDERSSYSYVLSGTAR